MSSPAPSKQIPASVLATANVTTLSRAVLKRDKSVPVAAPIADALRTVGVASGLPRGSVCVVDGAAPVAFTALLLAEANRAGGWVAWCASVAPNARALFDAGWYLDRVACVDPQRQWVACMNACVGEFELVVTHIPSGVPAGDVRRVFGAASRSGGVVVVLGGEPQRDSRRAVSADIEFHVESCGWPDVDAGHLSVQSMRVVVAGRRVPEPHAFVIGYGSP